MDEPTIEVKAGLELRWFLLGCFFLLVAIGFAGWAFSFECLSPHRQRILQWALPVASGFMAWTFAGSIVADAKSLLKGAAIVATGGFAVWLITTYVLIPTVGASCIADCTPQRPCVDIVRLADFTRSKCNSDGTKHDVVHLDDTYTLDPPADRYRAKADRREIQKQRLRVFDLSVSDTVPIPDIGGGVPGMDAHQMEFSARFVDGVARVRYEWTDTHQGEGREALGFLSNYRIRNITADFRLPPSVAIAPGSTLFFQPKKAKDECDHALKQCRKLHVDTEVEMEFRWNMWDRCLKPKN